MKNLIISAIASTLLLTACNSAKQASTGKNYDDVYYSSKNKPEVPAVSTPSPAPTNPGNYSSNPTENTNSEASRFDYSNNQGGNTATQGTGSGNTYVTNNYYNNDDYYDYAYSSRIRRFYNPVGYSYYDPYYTNSYWYDYNPYSWGISIYSTYSWWAPAVYYSYNPYSCGSWGVSIGYYGGWNPYCYRPYYYPYGYNPYYGGCSSCCNTCGGYGYTGGYYNGLYGNSYSPYYYNSYDSQTHYYGSHANPGTAGGSGAGTVNYVGGRGSHLQNNLATAYVSSVNSPANISAGNNGTGPVKGSSLSGSDVNSNIKNTNSGNVTGGIKPTPSGLVPVKSNSYTNSSDIKSDVKNNGDIKTGTSQGDVKNNGNVKNTYSAQPGSYSDVKGSNTGDVKYNTQPGDVPNNNSNPNNQYNTAPNTGGVKQPYNDPRNIKSNSNTIIEGSDPRNNNNTPSHGDVKYNNGGNIKSEAPANSGNGRSKWNSIFGSSHPNSYSSGESQPKYTEPKKGGKSEYSQPRNDAPKHNSQPSYQAPKNNSQSAPRQDNRNSTPSTGAKKDR